MNLRPIIIATVLAAILILPMDALACACCAEPGTYRLNTAKPSSYEIELLQKMEFDNAAELFLDAGGADDIKGFGTLLQNTEENEFWKFSVKDVFAAQSWTLDFTSYNGKTGSFKLPLPTSMVNFKVDTHENEESTEPILYKEWRFKGNVQSGTGFLKSGIVNPTTYFLVLQGRGNNCDNAEDFTHWRLEIRGKRAEYAFFGKLSSGEVRTVPNDAESVN